MICPKIFSLILLIPCLLFGEGSNQAVFTHIYNAKVWGCNESGDGYSGSGSRLDQTDQYRLFLQRFLKTYNINSVVDLGCGDWTFSQAIDWSNIKYQGFDVVEHIIEKNKKTFQTSNISFQVMDACTSNLPSADLLICKDVLQHLPNKDIQALLKKCQNYKYCLITNDIDPITKTSSNPNIVPGGYRYVDLRKPPFSLNAMPILTYNAGPNLKQVLLVTSSDSKPDNQIPINLNPEHAKVLIAILARNKAHVLPSYLNCIDNLDYNKKNISIYINTNNNVDDTEEILNKWISAHESDYESIEFDVHSVDNLGTDFPHAWNSKRFKTLALIRNKSLQKAIDKNVDFYLVVDCDNFIAPNTLSYLIAKNKPIIAPMLRSIPDAKDPYSNYFCAISNNGYYAKHPDFYKILKEEKKSTFEVPLVHCTYLIRKDALSQLNYIDGTQDYEFVIFSRSARNNSIPQFICNEQKFGTLLHFMDNEQLISLEDEKELFKKAIHLIKTW